MLKRTMVPFYTSQMSRKERLYWALVRFCEDRAQKKGVRYWETVVNMLGWWMLFSFWIGMCVAITIINILRWL